MTENERKMAGFEAARRVGSCPLCGRPTERTHRPFCSRRCADIDLGRWLGEKYRVSRALDLDEQLDVELDGLAADGSGDP